MPRQTEKMCQQCGERRAQEGDYLCRRCAYQNMIAFENTLEQGSQDWSFIHCEECGSTLDSEGICRNQSCGASPDVGKDWI